ncbi:O-methyltransferase bik3 [Talaromyces pinophilus]|nr:O-methyltransferase bik3 [Talaromyces pinophilus]
MAELNGNHTRKSLISLLKTYERDLQLSIKSITDYLEENGMSDISSDVGATNLSLPPTAPTSVLEARQNLISSAYTIQQIATEPAEYIPYLAIHYQVLSCFQWLIRFNILPIIPLTGSISYGEIAEIAKVSEDQLRRVIRMVITSNLLAEPSPNQVAHNAVSSTFVKQPGFMSWAKFMITYSAPTAASFADASEKWGDTVKKNETAFNVAFSTDKPFFDYLAQSAELTETFAAYMKSVQGSYGTSLKHLVNGLDWDGLGEATVVDVGGSTCASSIALADAYPSLQFIVQDLPDTIKNAPAVLSKQPESIQARIKTQPYDFFTVQKHHDADVYMLRMILHDWPAEIAINILKNQLPALRASYPRSRLLVMDTVLPTPGSDSVSIVDEALLRVRDLTMMQTFNSKEREVGDFIDIFSKAADEHGYLYLKSISKPVGSVMSIMEVGYRPYPL